MFHTPQEHSPHCSAGTSCSAVIRACNEEKHIGRLLAGIAQQTLKDIEVILVDSGSTDATIATAEKFAGDLTLKVLHIQPEQFTFGRSLNLGIEHARGEHIVIASAHVYPVYPDWLERLLAPFEDSKTGLTYGKQRGGESTQFSEHQVFAHWFPEQSQPRQATPFCNNANAAIRRSLWEQHPYDETLTGLEDLAWARWLVDTGYAIAYVAEAEVIHVHNETHRGVYNRYRREAMAFKRIFPQEHFTLADFLRLVTFNIANDLWQAFRHRRAHPNVNLGSILWFRWMQFWGTYQGYRHSGPVTWQLRRTFYYPRQTDAVGSGASRAASRQIEPICYSKGDLE
ncbi:MAG: glycosyltransferase family A protein [Chloroflexota bacterium]